jgi:hypothetical protein
MKAFVFKQSNSLVGKFDVSSIDQIPSALVKFGESNTLSAYDYLECSGKTWTLTNGSQGLELVEGRQYGSSAANSADDTFRSGQQGDVTSRYKDAYLTAGAISGIGGVIKALGIIFGLILILIGFIAGSELGIIVVLSSLVSGVLGGTILYVIGVLVSAQGQILKATLDTAVHTSPFLNDDQRLAAMRLKR